MDFQVDVNECSTEFCPVLDVVILLKRLRKFSKKHDFKCVFELMMILIKQNTINYKLCRNECNCSHQISDVSFNTGENDRAKTQNHVTVLFFSYTFDVISWNWILWFNFLSWWSSFDIKCISWIKFKNSIFSF